MRQMLEFNYRKSQTIYCVNYTTGCLKKSVYCTRFLSSVLLFLISSFLVKAAESKLNNSAIELHSIYRDEYNLKFINLSLNNQSHCKFLNYSNENNFDKKYQIKQSVKKWNHPLLGFLFILISVVTIFGNCLVICAVIKERCLKSATNYYIISLAVADLIVGLLVMPFNGLNIMTFNFWFFGQLWYKNKSLNFFT